MKAAQGVPERVRWPGMTIATCIVAAATVAAIVLRVSAAAAGVGVMAESALTLEFALAVVIALVQLAMALVVAAQVPGNVVAVLLAAMGLIVVLTDVVPASAAPTLGGTWMLLYLPLALVLLVAPTGHPATPAWFAAGATLCGVVISFVLVCAGQVLWPAAADALVVASLILLAAFFALLVACAIAPFARYRTSDPQGRLQLRWVLVAGTTLPLTLLLCWASYLVLGAPTLVALGLVVMLIVIPAAVTIAQVNPELFDIDRVTVVIITALMLVTTGLVALSVCGLAFGQPLSEWDTIPAAITTGAVTLSCVLAFPFARRGLDRILFPDHGRAIGRLRLFSRRVDAGVATPEHIQDVLRGALRDPGLMVAYRRLADRALVGVDGVELAMTETSAPVRMRGEEIGAIVPSADQRHRPAATIARAAAPLIDAVRSRSELATAATEIEASRARLLRAGYEERRRLERDLHDGTQQRLVALGMQLRVLQRTVLTQPGDEDRQIAETLDTVVTELGTAVAELRRVAHGVRPSALDDGLGAALSELRGLSPDTIDLDVDAGETPDVVALTAYFVVSEAVSNALRHAGAARIRVVVRRTDDLLRIRVADDGCGGAVAQTTGGLTGLSDRVEALGGGLRLTSRAGRGTTVEAVLPCES